MTTTIRVEHRGGNYTVAITERAKREGAVESAPVATLNALGEEKVLHVHADNEFIIRELPNSGPQG